MVDAWPTLLEWGSGPKSPNRYSGDLLWLRCSVGWSLSRAGSARVLDHPYATPDIKLSRAYGYLPVHADFYIGSLRDKHVHFLCDCVTTVAHLNVQGSSSRQMSNLAQRIWATALENRTTILYPLSTWLKGAGTALQMDCLMSLQYGWRLHLGVWQYVARLWTLHMVDRVASLSSIQLPRDNSLC